MENTEKRLGALGKREKLEEKEISVTVILPDNGRGAPKPPTPYFVEADQRCEVNITSE